MPLCVRQLRPLAHRASSLTLVGPTCCGKVTRKLQLLFFVERFSDPLRPLPSRLLFLRLLMLYLFFVHDSRSALIRHVTAVLYIAASVGHTPSAVPCQAKTRTTSERATTESYRASTSWTCRKVSLRRVAIVLDASVGALFRSYFGGARKILLDDGSLDSTIATAFYFSRRTDCSLCSLDGSLSFLLLIYMGARKMHRLVERPPNLFLFRHACP